MDVVLRGQSVLVGRLLYFFGSRISFSILSIFVAADGFGDEGGWWGD